MPDRSVADHIKTEELYTNVADYIVATHRGEEFNETEFRRRLDPILAMGKAIGRRTALDELAYPEELKDLRHFRDLTRKAVAGEAGVDLTKLVEDHKIVEREETVHARHGFEDRLINDWLKIVGVDVPRETSTGRIELPSEEELLHRFFPEHPKEY